jgi:hypothetical protein
MAKRQSEFVPATTNKFNDTDGLEFMRQLEARNALQYATQNQCTVVSYDVTDKGRFTEVAVLVRVYGAPQRSSAEWKAYLLVKKMHPSMYKEAKFGMEIEDGWDVYIRWAIWDNTIPRPNAHENW